MPKSYEPLILIDDNAHIDESRLSPIRAPVPAPRPHRLRQAAIALALIGAAVTGLQLAHGPATGSSSPARMATAGSTATPTVPAQFPKLVAPAEALAGQRLTLIAFQYHGLCPQTALLLDGVAMPIQIGEIISSAEPGWDSMVLTIDLPPTLTPGPHRLDLLGAMPIVGRRNKTCGGEPQHQEHIATATLLVD